MGRVDRNVPNRIANGNLDRGQRSIARWFDTAAFVGQPFGTFGNSGSGILEMPGVNNVDLALLKDTTFHERYRLQFRSEFFNAFNHPSFGQPNLSVGSASFGIIRSQRTNPREIQFGLKFYW